ncbi:ribulokinase [Paracoccus pacificus]|uniref:Ribulokinase n=1 Tax=Paracoccus pacificus TaxID=1463598 RepID=A0ABW4R9N8_9RHOB
MFTVGLDYGSNSVRTVVIATADGREMGSCVFNYPSGEQGILLDHRDPLLARQNPADYLTGLRESVRGAIKAARAAHPDFDPGRIVGIGIGTTGSSPLPVDAQNRALGMLPEWRDNLNAQCWLWKDHTAWREAEAITAAAAAKRPEYLAVCGGVYSSEWFWAKIWHCLNVAPEVFDAAASWVEIADWLPAVLAGVQDPGEITRGICAAGHKAMFSDAWGGLPDAEYLAGLDPRLAELRPRLYDRAFDAATPSGRLSAEWAETLGLPADIPIAIGALDVHYGTIGCGVTEGSLIKVIGTSTCDCTVLPQSGPMPIIPGICGIVPGSILPGFFGIEAGQSAVGDIFRWWVDEICQGDDALHARLTAEADVLRPGQSGLLALDWNNGNRTILVDQRLSGLLLGQSLYTSRAEVYRALIEATAFGARAIIERLREFGVPIERVICTGGIAGKNPMVMQIYADVTGCAIHVASSGQACALGCAITSAVLAGAQPDFATAEQRMTSLRPVVYEPQPGARVIYDRLYGLYRQLHDSFGGLDHSADLSNVMKDLMTLRDEVAAETRTETRTEPATGGNR